MANRPLKEEGSSINMELNVGQTKLLKKMLATGLWGNTLTGAAIRLLDESLQKHANDQYLEKEKGGDHE